MNNIIVYKVKCTPAEHFWFIQTGIIYDLTMNFPLFYEF